MAKDAEPGRGLDLHGLLLPVWGARVNCGSDAGGGVSRDEEAGGEVDYEYQIAAGRHRANLGTV